MKKKIISILGSTGSIGLTSLKIVKKEKKLFQINVLSANKSYSKICSQIKTFKPKVFIISDKKIFLKVKNKNKNKNIKILNSFDVLPFDLRKNDVTVSAIPGLAGLYPTIKFIEKSKKILLANKESIICGWNIIKKISKKNNTTLVPIDSEHFSIKKLLSDHKNNEIKKIYITASGGPFLKLPLNKFGSIKPAEAIKHPKWSMGKKISVDSATLMNKILELIEAKKIFPFKMSMYEVIIHPQSLVHAIVKFKNGLTKFLYHEPDMIIPISNAIFNYNSNIDDYFKAEKQETIYRNIEFIKVDKSRFPSINLTPKLDKYISTPIVINAANEILVDHFLKNKISFNSIYRYLSLVLKDKNYKKYAIQEPNNLTNIYMIDKWARKVTISIIRTKQD